MSTLCFYNGQFHVLKEKKRHNTAFQRLMNVVASIGLCFLTSLFLVSMFSVQIGNALGQDDSVLHNNVSAHLTGSISTLTGSCLIGQTVTRSIGYMKESMDVLVGKEWSQADINANETGIFSGC